MSRSDTDPTSLRTFWMEDHLESSRLTARFNLGESGSFHTTVRELLTGCGLGEPEAADQLLELSLRDSPNWGCDELRALVSRLHPGSSPGDVLITTGTSEALFLLLHRLRPRRTALAMPAFQLLYEVPRSLGSATIGLPVRWDSLARPYIDEHEWIETLDRERPDCVIVNHPHNPSGLVLAPAFLARLVDVALGIGATVIGDEHYRFLASDTAPLGPTIYRRSPGVFVTGSFIKCLGCPGLRIGWCVGDRVWLAKLQSDKNYITHTVNPLSERISCHALSDLSSPIWDRHRASWRDNRRLLRDFLARSEALYGAPPQGGLVTSLAWRGITDRGGFEAAMNALRAASVFTLPLPAMELDTPPHLASGPFAGGLGIRLGLGARPPQFAQALDEIERAAADAREAARSFAAACFDERGEQEVAATAAEYGIWASQRLAPVSPHYNTHLAVRITGPLDPGRLQRSLDAMVARHDALRSRYVERDGRPVRRVAASLGVPLAVVPARDLDDALQRLHDDGARSFDLERGPILRARLLRISGTEHVLSLIVHHIAIDDASVAIVLRELAGIADASPVRTLAPPLPLDDGHAGSLAYWRQQLAGLTVAELPADHTRPAVPNRRAAQFAFEAPPGWTDGLRKLARQEKVTSFMVLAAALELLLACTTGARDVAIGTVVSTRDGDGTDEPIGLASNAVALRAQVSPAHTFRMLLRQVRAAVLDAWTHAAVPFETVVRQLSVERVPGRNPLFDVILSFERDLEPVAAADGLTFEPLEVAPATCKYDLSLYVHDRGAGMRLVWLYSTELFRSDTVQRMAARYARLLSELVADPDLRIDRLDVAGADERAVLARFNATASACPPPAALHELIETQATRTPGAIAVRFRDHALDGAELDRRANRLAGYLREVLGVPGGSAIGLCMESSLDAVVGILGILKAGCHYVPVPPSLPDQRLAALVADASVAAVVTDEHSAARVPIDRDRLVRLDADRDAIAACGHTQLPSVDPDSLAYILYTSGSTGRPKGVMVSHRSVVHLLQSFASFSLAPGDAILQHAELCFDISVWELFAGLVSGATVVIADPARRGDGRYLVELIAQHAITALVTVPIVLHQLVSAGLERCTSLRWAVCGGDVLAPELARRWVDGPGAATLINGYGPTETAVAVTAWRCTELPARAPLPIGAPVANTRIHILDADLRLAPIGVVGEIYIAGPQLARGYLGQPDRTAERFVPDPFADRPGSRLYRSGDLGRWLADGTIEIRGRADHQVKLRGYRIELGEIESALRSHPAVTGAVVRVVGSEHAAQLVGYVVGGAPASELERQLSATLPDYMVPRTWVVLDALPLLPSGKVDRAALPAPSLDRGGAPPRAVSQWEQAVVELLGELLDVERVDPVQNFYAAGGNSLLAIQLISRLHQRLGVELDVGQVLEAPTIAALAQLLAASSPADAAPIRPQPRAEGPVSLEQQRIWFLDRMAGSPELFIVPEALRLTGPLRVDALQRALDAVVARHDMLRSAVIATEQGPRQRIADAGSVSVPLVCEQIAEAPDLESAVTERLRAAAATPFDLSRPPLVRASLLRVHATEHVLILCFHHIAVDGWSIDLVIDELARLYRAFAADAPPPALADPAARYVDAAAQQRDWMQREAFAERLAYWRRQLAGLPALVSFPGDRPRPTALSYRGAAMPFRMSAELSARLHAACSAAGATVFMGLTALVQALLHRHTGGEDIPIGTAIANRNRGELGGVVGLFVNMLVLRGDLSGAPSFAQLLERVKRVALDAYRHQDVPFDAVVRALRPEHDLGHAPLFQVAVLWQSPPQLELALGELVARRIEVASQTAKYDLTLSVHDHADEIRGFWEYATDLFEPATIARLSDQLVTLLAGALAHPATPIAMLPLVSAGEHRALVERCRAAPSFAPAGGLAERLAEQAVRSPNAVAIRAAGAELTYRELDARADRVAGHLRALGVDREAIVGVCAERSPELVALLLGILRAGGAYLPLDPSYPADRLAFLLGDAGARLVVCERAWLGALPATAPPVVTLDRFDEPVPDPASLRWPPTDPDQLAYVMYTSGSTGVPKAVAVSHRAIARLVDAGNPFAARRDDVFLLLAPLSFDASTLELWSPLLAGATLAIAPPGQLAPAELGAALASFGVTTLWLTASLFHAIVDAAPDVLAGVDRLLAGGEPLSPVHIARALDALPGCTLINGYGPTENTVFTTCHVIARGDAEQRSVPVGRPIAGTRVYVLDAALNPVPVGVAGELYAAGDGLARGYHGRPELTSARFVPDPFAREPGQRMYRTGDLARSLPDGTLELVGRLDDQVKIRGLRVEPGEIVACLEAHPDVAIALVVAADRPHGKELVGYVVPAPGAATEPHAWIAELRGHLQRTLPEFMVPAGFVRLERLPLLPSGKVDRGALPAPSDDRGHAPWVAPTGPTEQALAAIWCEVLGVSQVSAADDFFDLGGHSLLVAQVAARVQARLGVALPLRTLFDARTIATLAQRITAAGRPTAAPSATAVRPAPRRERHPLSFAQERFWFMSRLEPDRPWFNVPLYLRLRGPLRVDALEHVLELVVHRHEPLRTRIAAEAGAAHQVVATERFRVAHLDLEATAASDRDHRARQLADEQLGLAFDLERAPPFRAVIARFAPDDHLLLATAHHIAVDGWSLPLLGAELRAAYAARVAGELPALPELAIRYVDYAEWQREPAGEAALTAGLAYWTERLAGVAAPAELPTDRRRGAAMTAARARTRSYRLPAAMHDAAGELARREAATLFMVLLAAFELLVHRSSGATDIVIGSPIAGRESPELERLVGCFVNTVALRTDLSGRPSFRELVGRVRDTALGAYDHQRVPFERVMQTTQTGRQPLFRLLFALAPPATAEPRWGAIAASRVAVTPTDTQTPGWDIGVHWGETDDGLVADVGYSVELFDPDTVDRMMRHFEQLLGAALTAPDRPIDELEMLSTDERRALVAPPSAPGTAERLHDLVAAQVARAPDRVAVSGAGGSLTYEALWQCSGRLADQLRARGVGPEDRVAVYLDPCPERVVALLAILRAGAAFVALDPAYRSERLRFVIDDAHAHVLVTCRRLRDELPGPLRRDALCLDDPDRAPIAPAPGAPPVDPDQLAYVLYTSGSTGVPKGAALSHRAICDQLRWSERAFSIGADDCVLHICSIGFDVAIMEVFAPLVAGARLAIGGAELARDVAGLARFIRDERVTISVGLIQPLLQALIDSPGFDACTSLRHVIQGGEALLPATRDAFVIRSRAQLHNAYGATEIAIDGTCATASAADLGQPVSIGRAIDGLGVYVLDDRLAPVPVGVTGEIYFAGSKLARGYWDRPALTAESFVPAPFGDRPGQRMYRTGDLARRRADGELEFQGRRDGQVKVRGFRVELGDIEATLALHPAVRQARVVKTTADQLAAYVVAAGTPLHAEELRAFLRTRLPPYMVPAGVHLLDELPTLPSGKLDLRALPDDPPGSPAAGPDALETDTQRQLAALWRDLLGTERIAPHEDFFDLGGHSLLLISLQADVAERFGRELSIAQLLAAASLHAMAALIDEAGAATRAGEPAIAVARRQAVADRARRSVRQQPEEIDDRD